MFRLALSSDSVVRCHNCDMSIYANIYVELQDQWNGPYFFLKKSYLSLRCPKLSNFFSSAYYLLYLHTIIDLGQIWGPFMAKFDKKN